MKTVKLKNVEVSAEDIRKLVRDNPDLLKPEVKGRYFFPKDGEECFYPTSYGEVSGLDYREQNNDFADMGVFNNTEETKLAIKKQKAIVACWKWSQENAPFEPDWGNFNQEKYYTYYNYEERKLDWASTLYFPSQFTLPYFKSHEDHEAFIKANKENLELLFTK